MDEKEIGKLRKAWQAGIWVTLVIGTLLTLVLFIFDFENHSRAYYYVLTGVYMFVSAFIVELLVEGILFYNRYKEEKSSKEES